MRAAGLYWNRRCFYTGLFIIGGMMLIDATPQYTLLHGYMKNWIDPVLDKTGLWQGSWELFAPTPDHVNVKVAAVLNWDDGTETEWEQPNWHEMTPWEKMRYFRQMSFYDGLWRDSNKAAWEPFCDLLVKEQSVNRFSKCKTVFLYQERDVIPSPTEEFRRAYSKPKYGRPSLLYRWRNDE